MKTSDRGAPVADGGKEKQILSNITGSLSSGKVGASNIRGPKSHVNARILAIMVSWIPLVLGRRTRIGDTYYLRLVGECRLNLSGLFQAQLSGSDTC